METDPTLIACPHCGGRPGYEIVPEGDPGGFGGRMYISCTNNRCGACTGLSIEGMPAAESKEFLARKWNARTNPELTATRMPPAFPVALRKMWSGAEVQDWINANWMSQS